jgi:pyrimidine-nucleoside phosphorylase
MRAVDIITRKRDGIELSREEITNFLHGVVNGTIPDYQTAAWLMAVFLRGMTRRETVDLTLAMAQSGDTLDLSDLIPYAVDKHSSGGVGDKTSLVVVPLVAACGVPLAKMSGRALGYSGGTLDKLEAIPGFRVGLSGEEFRALVRENGIVLAGQSLSLAPADGKLYALRDVTGTVPSLPLIASSIMSKKIAAGANGILLDVKLGTGAFMKTLDEARELALIMVQIGEDAGRDVTAVLSDMNQPLGEAIGNALEVEEAVQTLKGQGPEDFTEHCLVTGSEMLRLAGQGARWQDDDENRAILMEKLNSGEAFDKFRLLASAQGGDTRVLDDTRLLPQAPIVDTFLSPQDGWLAQVDALQSAVAAFELGAGREKKEDPLDLSVGIRVHVKQGDAVRQGQVLATLYASDPAKLATARATLSGAFRISPTPTDRLPLFYGTIRGRELP